MKKTLILLFVVLMTATLFVACSSSPNKLAYVATITVGESQGDAATYTGTYYLKSGDDLIPDSDDTLCLYKDEDCTTRAFEAFEEDGGLLINFAENAFCELYFGEVYLYYDNLQAGTTFPTAGLPTNPEGTEINVAFKKGDKASFYYMDTTVIFEVVADTTIICSYGND